MANENLKSVWSRPWFVIGLGLLLWLVFNLVPYGLAWYFAELKASVAGTIGDASGLANSFLNTAAVIFVAWTFNLQRKQIALQRRQLTDERELIALSAGMSGLADLIEIECRQIDWFTEEFPDQPEMLNHRFEFIDDLVSMQNNYMRTLDELIRRHSSNYRKIMEQPIENPRFRGTGASNQRAWMRRYEEHRRRARDLAEISDRNPIASGTETQTPTPDNSPA